MKPRYKYVEQLANSVLEKHDELCEDGVPVVDLCEDLGLEYQEDLLEDSFSGAAIVDGDRKIVLINESHPETRKRFSTAHEIGHLLLHGNQSLSIDNESPVVMFRDEKSSKGVDWREKEANFFAACLLMPRQKLLYTIQKLEFNLLSEERIQELAEKFEVSVQAMCIRLSQLGFLTS